MQNIGLARSQVNIHYFYHSFEAYLSPSFCLKARITKLSRSFHKTADPVLFLLQKVVLVKTVEAKPVDYSEYLQHCLQRDLLLLNKYS